MQFCLKMRCQCIVAGIGRTLLTHQLVSVGAGWPGGAVVTVTNARSPSGRPETAIRVSMTTRLKLKSVIVTVARRCKSESLNWHCVGGSTGRCQ